MSQWHKRLINRLNPRAPKGIIDSAEEWIKQQSVRNNTSETQTAAWLCDLETEEVRIFDLSHAQAISGDSFEPLSRAQRVITPKVQLYNLNNCRILGSEGVIISNDNRVFSEFTYSESEQPNDYPVFRRRRIPPLKHLSGQYASIVYPSSRYYYHWIVESLPRMRFLGKYLSSLDGIFVPSLTPFIRDSLSQLGISENKLIPVDSESHFCPERLLIPTFISSLNPPNWLHQWYQQQYLHSPNTSKATSHSDNSRIYISRGDANVRRVINEDEVMEFLSTKNFKSIALSEFNFSEQASLFHNAEVIIAPHGAGLANLVFCKSFTKVLEIFSPNWQPPCFFVLAEITGCNYWYMLANEGCEKVTDFNQAKQENLEIPLSKLKKFVATLDT